MAKTILLIEYEPRYLDRIKGYLAGKDFDLVVAKDGEDGLITTIQNESGKGN